MGGQALEAFSYLPKVGRVRGGCDDGCLKREPLEPLTSALTPIDVKGLRPAARQKSAFLGQGCVRGAADLDSSPLGVGALALAGSPGLGIYLWRTMALEPFHLELGKEDKRVY